MYSFLLVATAMAAGRSENGRERTVFIQAVQKRNHDRKSATAKNTFAEDPVFRPENKERNQNPKGGVSL